MPTEKTVTKPKTKPEINELDNSLQFYNYFLPLTDCSKNDTIQFNRLMWFFLSRLILYEGEEFYGWQNSGINY